MDISYPCLEVIVVDNDSKDNTSEMIKHSFPQVKYIRLPRNSGTEGRNVGIVNSNGDIIIMLDDDVLGINRDSIYKIIHIFNKRPNVAAVCFKITDYHTGEISNWCHHYKIEEFSNREFITAEITEGAVAYRKKVLDQVGYYPSTFFISNEGPDLACRILNKGYDVIFCPEILVKHRFSGDGRESWRRYYYDTRNHFWFAARNYRFWYGVKYVLSKILVMLAYSIRDGFFLYWCKGVFHGLLGLPRSLTERNPISRETEQKIKMIDKNRPGFGYMFKRRWKSKGVRP